MYFDSTALLCRTLALGEKLPLVGHKFENPDMTLLDPPICCSVLKDDLLGCENELEYNVMVSKRPLRCVRQFDEIDSAGTEILYRCVECRGCPKCKTSMRFDSISIQEELEQGIIERCVMVDLENSRTVAKLPFLVDPESRLVSNETQALNVFRRQVKRLSLKPEDKSMVIEFENKLQDMGFVEYFGQINEPLKSQIMSSTVKNFIPWITVFN